MEYSIAYIQHPAIPTGSKSFIATKIKGTQQCRFLGRCATRRKIAGSNLDQVIGFFKFG
jgi:hypothetical protein